LESLSDNEDFNKAWENIEENMKKSNIDDLSNVLRVDSRHFWNKKKEYLKAKIDERETNNNKTKNIRQLYSVINELKEG
jgi:alpha/beta superfamily hydrolase